MPLYEFLRLAIEKLESSQQNPCSVDLSPETEDDLFGRVTENVQITTQMQPDTPSVCDDATLGNSVTARIEKSGGVEYIFNDISPVLPSAQLDFSQKDETVPWLSYPVDGSLQDYSSSVSAKKMLAGNSLMWRQNGSRCDQTVSDLDAVKLSSLKAHPLQSWLHQKGHTSDPSLLSRDFSILSNGKGNCQDAIFGNSGEGRDLVSDSSSKKMESRSIALSEVNSRQLLAMEPKELFVDGRTKKITLQNKASNSTRALHGDRTVESIVASSSVSSGNSADKRVSLERKQNTERKLHGIEESECQSDTQKLQNESVGAKKSSPAQGGRGSKRSRAAEVHNLSERRRRDRINEKMRALQELIPNCNKADKASMLDEAIEYLKNLKHQVQIMSMGSGLCVPPLMFPPGTRHMYHAPIPHFSYMGVRMGVNSSFENTNGGSPLCPVFPVLPIPGHPGPGAHLVPLTGWHQTSALRVPSHNEVPTTPSNKSVFHVEASSSIHCTSSQLQATNEVEENNGAADGVMTTGKTNEEAGKESAV